MKNQDSNVKHLDIHVMGMVQGVCFRAAAREKASSLGIKGFVRNEPNGSVFIEAEGPEECLEELVAWCRQGPPSAHVKNIDVKVGKPQRYTTFVIRYF